MKPLPHTLLWGLLLLGGWGIEGLAAHTMVLRLVHQFGERPLVLDSLRYASGEHTVFSVERLSYLLTGWTLTRSDGETVTLPPQTAWIDLEARRTEVALKGIPEGNYTHLSFYLGPDVKTNHADPASFAPHDPLNPAVNGLHWNWQGGFVFMALEGKFRWNAESVSGYSFHLARDPNRTALAVELDLTMKGDTQVDITMNLEHLLQGASPISFHEDGRSTHSNEGDPIAASLVLNLQDVFAVKGIRSLRSSERSPTDDRPKDLPGTWTPYPLKIGRQFPIPALPRDNPLIQERVDLGRRLFHDPVLSVNRSQSCASCHLQAHAMSDPKPFSVGALGKQGKRNAMPLFNLAWKSRFFWDGRAASLREQSLIPIEDHLEMAMPMDKLVNVLKEREDYRRAFRSAFGSGDIHPENIGLALESFLLTLVSHRSKFDRVMEGVEVFSPKEQRGFDLFMTEYEPRTRRYGADCFHCHGGPLFTDHRFHNNGLDATDAEDPGRFAVTEDPGDRGKFMTPSLRNLTLTAPYMHDGRFETLAAVVAHYNTGVTHSPTLDSNLAKHPKAGLGLSEEDQQALVAFLKTLTDDQYHPRAAHETE